MEKEHRDNEIKWKSRADTGLLDRHMMQEFFFQCVEGALKKKQRRTHSKMASNDHVKKQYRYNKNRIFLMDCEDTGALAESQPEVQFTKQGFDHFSDSEKQQVLVDFVSNKAILAALFDMMF